MILSPYFWIAVLLASLAIFGTGYHNGYRHANDHAEALKLQAVTKVQKQSAEAAARDQQIAQNFEAARETVRAVYVTVKEKANENIENHPDYVACQLDADGLRLYNHNPNVRTPAAPGADGRMSGFASGTGWPVVDDPAQQRGASGAVLHLSGAPQAAIGMGNISTAGKTEAIAQAVDAP